MAEQDNKARVGEHQQRASERERDQGNGEARKTGPMNKAEAMKDAWSREMAPHVLREVEGKRGEGMSEGQGAPTSPSGAFPSWGSVDARSDAMPGLEAQRREAAYPPRASQQEEHFDAQVDAQVDAQGHGDDAYRQTDHADPSRGKGSDPGKVGHDSERPSRFEKMLRDTFRGAVQRGLEAGLETFSRTDKALRGVVDDVKLPRELAGYVMSQMDETRRGVIRLAAKEIRMFLEHTDLSAEMRKLLTSVSFEVRTEVRFTPNESGDSLRPEVKASVGPKRARS